MLPIAEAVHRHPFGQRVDHRRAYAVQAARISIVLMVKLAARVQLGIDDLHARNTKRWVHIDRNAAAVVPHAAGTVLVQGHGDLIGVVVGRLIDAVIHDLPEEVMEAAGAGGADVHAGAHAHGIKPIQYLQTAGSVFFGHSVLSKGRRAPKTLHIRYIPPI